jgi:hypothetical protein
MIIKLRVKQMNENFFIDQATVISLLYGFKYSIICRKELKETTAS